ncbi:MAG: SRPBCC family protein [Nocardioidaceae bacterium]
MPAAERSIVINRPVHEVFAFFTNVDNDPQWRPHLKEIHAAGPVGLGSQIHQVVEGPGGRGIPADMAVTGFEPPSRFAFEVTAGPVRPTGEFQFSEEPAGTRVSFSLRAELSGIKKMLLSRPVQRSMDGEMAALDKAKSVIEST